MIINQQKLDNIVIELLTTVTDYSLSLGYYSICFNDIIDKLELDLSVSEAFSRETLNAEQLEQLTNEVVKLVEEIKKWKGINNSIDWINISKEERDSIHADFPWRKKHPDLYLPDYIGLLINRKSKMEDIIKNKGEMVIPLLGSFSSDEKKVYLYLKNIERVKGKAKLTEPLITTFIHEMFHAWNYFVCNEKDRTVKEIDEAMVEFATLYFLKQISLVHNEFDQILKWAEENVRNKQESSGSIAAYGYGYYLYSLANKNESHVLGLLVAYIRKSGLIAPSALVDLIKAKLSPAYPHSEEEQVYIMIQQLLLHNCMVRGQVWSKSGKTNIVTRDNSLLFEENVDRISRLDIESINRVFILVEDKGLFKIYREFHGKWFPVFNDVFDKVKPIKYGKFLIILVKRHVDGKSFMISPLDIRRIRDIEDVIQLDDFMSADDFLITVGTDKAAYYLSGDILPIIMDNRTISVFRIENCQYSYIVPFMSLRLKMIDVDGTSFFLLQKDKGEWSMLPVAWTFFTYGLQFVYTIKNEDYCRCIYNIDGRRIGGEYDFVGLLYDNINFAIIEKEGKFNLFSFEKMKVYFDKWYEECDLFKILNDGLAYRIDVYRDRRCESKKDILDYEDFLKQWIEDSRVENEMKK